MRPECEQQYVDYLTASLPRLNRTAYLLCGDADRADDIVQSTALALYLHWKRIQAADNIDGYVHRTLVRQYLNSKRIGWAKVLLTDQAPELVQQPDTTVEERHLLVSALATLPLGQRTVLILRYYCDLSVEDAAVAMNCSQGNIKSQAARGLAALRRLIRSDSGDQPPESGGQRSVWTVLHNARPRWIAS
jgi:RNA polymerase sigma-70 factor (sigma-E family)